MPDKTNKYKLNKPLASEYYDIGQFNENAEIVDGALDGLETSKVSKVSGKGLSANDYTDAEKNKLAGIDTGANAYTHPNSGVTAGTYRSVTVNSQGHATGGSNPTTTVAQGGTGATDAATARNNLGVPPTSHASTATTYGAATTSEYGHVKVTTGNGLGLSSGTLSMSEATTTSTGAMTATDKAKLDGVAYNATSNAAYTSVPAANGTASAGSVANYSRGDHVHPLQTTVSGNAGTATKLATVRTIGVSGVAGTAQSFDGSANITIPITGVPVSLLNGACITATGDWNSYTETGFYMGSSLTNAPPATNGSHEWWYVIVMKHGAYWQVQIATDFNNKATYRRTYVYSAWTSWVLILDTTVGNAVTTSKLLTARTLSYTGDATGSTTFDGSANASTALTLANSGVTAGSYGPGANTTLGFGGSFYALQTVVDAKGRVTSLANRTITLPATPTTVSGNAGTATKLATARTINGTSFDGTSNITTTNWGTARTLTIGSTGKSVNGSANISWSLAEIGAAESSHTHDYLPLAGGTVTGTINSNGTSLTNGAISTNLNTATWLAANQGKSILNSTNSAGGYTSLFKTNSTNGYFTGGSHQTGMYVSYTAADTVTAGTNSTTKQAKLLDESGNSTFPGIVTAPTFSGTLSGNAATATKLATARTLSYTGDATGSTSFDGTANASTALTLSNSGATAGSYGPTAAATLGFGGSVNVPQVTVDAKGRATSVVNRAITLPAAPTTVSGNAGTATKLATARTLSLTGDATGSMSFDGSANASAALTLASSGVTAGSYGPTAAVSPQMGGTFNVPQITVDAKGRTTSVTNRTITIPGIVGIAYGGTGAKTAAEALTNLGVKIETGSLSLTDNQTKTSVTNNTTYTKYTTGTINYIEIDLDYTFVPSASASSLALYGFPIPKQATNRIAFCSSSMPIVSGNYLIPNGFSISTAGSTVIILLNVLNTGSNGQWGWTTQAGKTHNISAHFGYYLA